MTKAKSLTTKSKRDTDPEPSSSNPIKKVAHNVQPTKKQPSKTSIKNSVSLLTADDVSLPKKDGVSPLTTNDVSLPKKYGISPLTTNNVSLLKKDGVSLLIDVDWDVLLQQIKDDDLKGGSDEVRKLKKAYKMLFSKTSVACNCGHITTAHEIRKRFYDAATVTEKAIIDFEDDDSKTVKN